MIRQPVPNPVMPGKIYEILDAQDRVLIDQAAGTAAEAMAAAKAAFPQFAPRFRVAILKRKPELTTKPK